MGIDLSAQMWDAYQKALAKSKKHLEGGELRAAAAGYRQAGSYLKRYASYLKDRKAKREWGERAKTYEAWAEKLEAGERPLRAPVVADGPVPQAEDLRSEIEGLIVPRDRLSIHWDDIGGLEETKAQIKLAYGLGVARQPAGVDLPRWRGLLLYGPPGTGKTLLAAAIANGLDATFFNASTAKLLSKWFGESSRLINALYQTAREMEPSVVFLDEVEALALPRGGSESGAERRVVNAFLTEMDGLLDKGSSHRVLTVGATNMPWLLDVAILRRFEKKIYVPLPEAAARRAILDIHLHGRGYESEVPMVRLVEDTEGYSGAELERLCKESIGLMVERLNPNLLEMVDQGREALEQYEIRVGPIEEREWEEVLRRNRPETAPSLLARYGAWWDEVAKTTG